MCIDSFRHLLVTAGMFVSQSPFSRNALLVVDHVALVAPPVGPFVRAATSAAPSEFCGVVEHRYPPMKTRRGRVAPETGLLLSGGGRARTIFTGALSRLIAGRAVTITAPPCAPFSLRCSAELRRHEATAAQLLVCQNAATGIYGVCGPRLRDLHRFRFAIALGFPVPTPSLMAATYDDRRTSYAPRCELCHVGKLPGMLPRVSVKSRCGKSLSPSTLRWRFSARRL